MAGYKTLIGGRTDRPTYETDYIAGSTRYALVKADDECYLSDDANKSRDDYTYWSSGRFDLHKMENIESWSLFRS